VYIVNFEENFMVRFLRCATAIAFATWGCVAFASQQANSPGSEFDLGLTGRVSMEGVIYSTPCDIDIGDDYQTIAMPGETREHIKRAGIGEPKPFSIYLTNCSLSSSEGADPMRYMKIIFDGDEEMGSFKINGSASGLVLELRDGAGQIIHPGIGMDYQKTVIDDYRLDYKLRLKTTLRNLMVGDYNAIIRYRVEYF
jgi:type 1 fimbria pilin